MRLKLIRQRVQGDACLGSMLVKGSNGWEGYCVTLEDIPRDVKVMHETCIPAGTYQIKKREVLSGMTERYREIYGTDFDWHLELQNVPDFQYVYIHHGNKATHSSGCILVGMKHTTQGGNGFVTSSRAVFTHFYKMVSDALAAGEEVTIEIVEEF